MKRGRCPVCGQGRALRSDGRMRGHAIQRVPCAGSYQEPLDPASPEFQAFVDAQRQELARRTRRVI